MKQRKRGKKQQKQQNKISGMYIPATSDRHACNRRNSLGSICRWRWGWSWFCSYLAWPYRSRSHMNKGASDADRMCSRSSPLSQHKHRISRSMYHRLYRPWQTSAVSWPETHRSSARTVWCPESLCYGATEDSSGYRPVHPARRRHRRLPSNSSPSNFERTFPQILTTSTSNRLRSSLSLSACTKAKLITKRCFSISTDYKPKGNINAKTYWNLYERTVRTYSRSADSNTCGISRSPESKPLVQRESNRRSLKGSMFV